MADVIDEKVVSMQFDNQQFEEGVSESLKSIQELKNSLDFDKSVKNLNGLAEAGKKFDLSGISNAVEAVTVRFNALEVAGKTAIANLTNTAVNYGKHLVSSLTIDPVTTGVDIYEQKINSVQTILNNSGKSLKTVNKVLQGLNDYSDRTIFSLSDMTNALAKFTAQGVDLEKAVGIIKGAANEAATMGAGSAEFGRMIYNLTQAYGMGSMKILDWRSFENANVVGKEFKEQVIESAIRLGKLDKEGRTLDKHIQVTIKNFREMLSTGFMDAEVMTDVFEKYAGLNDQFKELGEKALSAAQDVKTFHQLLDVLKESVASQWSQIWSAIFGDFYEAKRLWTGISVIFEDTIGKALDTRKKMMQLWHDGFTDPKTGEQISGRKMLLDGFANILQTIIQLVRPVKEAFRELFPAKTAENIWEATKAFRDFTARLHLSETAMRNIKDFASGVFSVFRLMRDALRDVVHAIFPATEGINSLLAILLQMAGAFGRWLRSITEAIRGSEEYQEILAFVGKTAAALIKIIVILARTIFKLGKATKETGVLQKAFGGLKTALVAIVSFLIQNGPKILNILHGVVQVVATLAALLAGGVYKIGSFFVKLFSKKDGKAAAEGVKEVTESIGELAKTDVNDAGANVTKGFGQGLLSGVSALMQIVVRVFQGVVDTVMKIFDEHSPSKVFIAIGAFCLSGLLIGLTNPAIRSQITDALEDFANSGIIQGFKNALGKGFNGIAHVWTGAVNGITSLITNISRRMQGLDGETSTLAAKIGSVFNNLINGIKNINGAALLLTTTIGGAIVLLARLLKSVVNITHFIDEVGGSFFHITRAFDKTASGFKKMAKAFMRQQSPIVQTLKGIAAAILAITLAVTVLSTIENKESLWTAVGSLAAILLATVAILVTASVIVQKNDLEDSVKAMSGLLLSAAVTFGIMTVILASLASMIHSAETSAMDIIGAFFVILGLAFTMGMVIFAFSKIPITQGIKSSLLMLSFAAVMFTAVRALKKIAEIGKIEMIQAAMIALGISLGAVAMVAAAATGIPWSGVFALLAVTILIRTVMKAIDEIEWSGVMQQIEKYQDVIVALVVLCGLIAVGMHYLGQGIKDFGAGIMYLGAAMLLMGGTLALLKTMDADVSDLLRVGSLLMALIGMLALVMILCKKFKIPKGDMKALGQLMMSLGAVMVELGVAVGIAKYLGADSDNILAMGAILAAFTAAVTLPLKTASKATKADVKGLTKLIKAFMAPILALALLAKASDGISFLGVMAMVGTMMVVMGGLVWMVHEAKGAKEKDVKALNQIVKMLLVVALDLVLISMIPFGKLILSAIALAGVVTALIFLTGKLKDVKPGSFKPLMAVAAMLAVIGADLTVMAKLCDWGNLLAAAGSMAIVILSVVGALAIIDKLGKKAINGATSLVIASASLLIIGGALTLFGTAFNWDAVLPACVAVIGLAGALAIVGNFGKEMILGATSLVIASVGLIGIGFALQMFAQVCNTSGLMEAFITVSVVVLGLTLILGALSESGLAILGAAALILTSIGLIALAKAMQMMASANLGTEYLSSLAVGLLEIAVAGIALTLGVIGLVAGGLGLILIASAMKILSGVDSKIINEGFLVGLAHGLTELAKAGLALTLGAAGLIIGGIGLGILSGGLWPMSMLDYSVLNKHNLTSLGKGLIQVAKAGMVGTFGGPGLIVLAIGLTAIAGAVSLYTRSIESLIQEMIDFGDNEAIRIGNNVIAGMTEGMVGAAPTMLSATQQIFQSMVDTVRATLGIHSPSSVLRAIGEFTGLGFLEGWANSEFVQKLDRISAAIAEEGVIKPFAGTLAEGFGDIGEVFKNFDLGFDFFGGGKSKEELEKELEDWRKKLAAYQSKYRDMLAGRANEQAIKSQQGLINATLAKIEEVELAIKKSENSLFGEFGKMFEGFGGGIEGLASEFSGLEDILKSTGVDMDALNIDASQLADGLGDLSDASKDTTKSFAENMDIFAAFDRSLKTTVSDIEKNMIDQLLGTNQWNQYLENLVNLGFDPRLVKEIKDMGMSSGYQIAAVLNSVGTNYEKVMYYNELFADKYTEGARNDFLSAWIDGLAKDNAEAHRDMSKYINTQDQYSGDIAAVTEGQEDQAAMWEESSKEFSESAERGAKLQAEAKRNITEQERQAAEDERKKAAEANAQQTTADAMMSEMSDAIKKAIKKFLPASEFVSIGENICLGLTAGIIRGESMTVAEVENLCIILKEQAMKTLKEHSPSRVFKQIGEYCTEGLALGLQDSEGAEKSASELGNSLIDQMMDQLQKIQSLIEGDEIWQPTIRPVVDLSNLQASAEQARALFDGTQIQAAARDISNYKASSYSSGNTLAGMSKSDFAQYLSDFAEAVVDGINRGERTITVPITIKNDPHRQFEAMVDENNVYKRTTGHSAFV